MKRFIHRSIAIILAVTMLPFASFADAGVIKAYAAAPSLSQNATVQPEETTEAATSDSTDESESIEETVTETVAVQDEVPVAIAEEEEITTHGGEEIDAFVNAYLKDPEAWEAEHPEISIEDVTVEQDRTLDEDLVVKDLYLNNGQLALNGHTLYVCGDLYQTGGELLLEGGKIVVLGDYDLEAEGQLTMSNEADYILVMGAFHIESDKTTIAFQYGSMEVKGNVVLVGPIQTGEPHRFILSGEEEQHVSLLNDASFGTLELQNYSEKGVIIDTYARWERLITNGCSLTLPEVVQNADRTLQEDETIPGDYVIEGGNLDLNGHTLTIEGSLIQSKGRIDINGGSLIIEGDYRRQSRTKNEDGGYEYGVCAGNLWMGNESDYMLVMGDFYDYPTGSAYVSLGAGCLELKGSYYQLNETTSYSFSAYGSHTLLLSGDGKQVLSCPNEYEKRLRIYNLEITNTSEDGVLFQGCVGVKGLCNSERDSRIEGIIYKESNFLLNSWGSFYNGDIAIYDSSSLNSPFEIGGDLYMQRMFRVYADLTVDGNIYMYNHDIYNDDVGINLYAARLIVKGNVEAKNDTHYNGIYMQSSSSYVLIEGDYILHKFNGRCYSAYGTLELKGNLITYGSLYLDCTLLLRGDKKQEISVSSDTYIKNLVLYNTSEEGICFKSWVDYGTMYNATGCKTTYFDLTAIGGFTLTNDLTIDRSVVMNYGTMDLNGHTLHITGDLIQLDGTMDINGGSLIVDGGYYLGNPETMWDESAQESSVGYLFMDDPDDYVLVKGDFLITFGITYIYREPYYSTRSILTDGVLEVKGNFLQKESTGQSFKESSFPASGNHTVILSGEEGQTVWFSVTDKEGSRFHNLRIENTSEEGITFKGVPCVAGTVYGGGRENHIKGSIALSSLDQINEDYFAGSITNSGTMTIDSDKGIGGDFIITGGSTTNSNVIIKNSRLKIDGNLVLKGILELSEAQVEVLRNVSISQPESIYTYYGILMEHDSDYLLVHGDFRKEDNDSAFTKGTLEVKGNYTDTSTDTYGTGHRVLLSGSKLQTVDAENVTFGTLELQNHSMAGVYSETPIKKNKLILNGCRLTIGDGSGIYGFTLTEDYIAAGDMTLLDDTLDLNGHTLTVQGDLILQGGEVDINGGELIVEGNLRYQSRKLDKTDESLGKYLYTPGYGHLIMDEKEDRVTVKGDVIAQAGESILGDLSLGTVKLWGDIRQIGDHALIFDNQVVFVGGKKQTVYSDAQITFQKIAVSKSGKEGVVFMDDTLVKGTIEDPDKKITGSGALIIADMSQLVSGYFGGNLILEGNSSLEGSIEIGGNLTIAEGSSLDCMDQSLRTANLIVDGTIDTKTALIIIENNLTVQNNGLFIMTNDSYVLVKKNVSFTGPVDHEGYLTKGTLEILGDFTDSGWNRTFIATGDHYTIFRKRNISPGESTRQSMNIDSPNYTHFAKLELTKDLLSINYQEGGYRMVYSPDRIADEVILISLDAIIPEPISSLTAQEVTVTSAYLSYAGNWEEDIVKGFVIFRDGVKVGETTETGYRDTGLMPGHTYTYQVYPFNKDKTLAASSPSYVVVTPEDMDAPSAPANLEITKRTGSAITLSWSGARDNVGVEGYRLYRDETLIYEGTDCTYKDTGLKENTLYTYYVIAYDAAGWESAKSDRADGAVFMPKITSVYPEDYAIIGGDSVRLEVRFANDGNSKGNAVLMEYYDPDAEQFISITQSPLGQKNYDRENLYTFYEWDIRNLTFDGDMDVRFTVTDEDGNKKEQIVTYTLDRTPPKAPESISAEDDGGTAVISWVISASGDCVGYELYKLNKDTEKAEGCIAYIEGRNSGWYRDEQVEDGTNYAYYVRAVDAFGQKSPMSDVANVFIEADTKAPRVSGMKPDAGKVNKITKLEITGSDNRGVDAFDLYIRAWGEEEWSFLTNVTAKDNEGSFDWDTTLYEEDTYYIKVVAKDKSGNESVDLFQRRYEVDNTGIAKIRLLDPSVGSTMIQLAWEDVTESDFGWFIIEELVGEEWKTVGRVSDRLGYRIENLKPEHTYTYRVTGVDHLGNVGIPSDRISVTTLSDTAAPVITAIFPISSFYKDTISLSMQVQDNAGVSYGRFSYSVSGNTLAGGEEFAEIAVIEGSGAAKETLSYVWDISALPEGEITVRFEAWDTAGLHNALYEDAQIENKYIIDRQPPEQVTGVTILSEEGAVVVSWDSVSDKDVASYEIQRAVADEGIYQTLGTTGNILYYYDADVKQGVAYSYRIAATDIAGNRGEFSKEVIGTVKPDETAPIVTGISPTDSMIGSDPTLKILVTDNAALASVSIEYREEDSPVFKEIETITLSGRASYQEFTWDTLGLKEGVNYEIRAKAADTAGNESEYAYKTYQLDLTPPKKPEVTAQTGSFRIELSYTENEEEDFRCYKIYRRAYGETEYACIQATTQNTFIDEVPETDTMYYYKVRAYDIYDNYSESESVVSYANHVDQIAPVADLPDTIFGFTGMEIAFDGTLCNDNVRINRYSWDFGDGTGATGVRPFHTYEQAGIYTVTLTVSDANGNEAMTMSNVQIMDKSNNGSSVIRVLSQDGNAISGAYVYLKMGNNEEDILRLRTDVNGEVRILGKTGVYEYAVYAQDHMPADATFRISNYETLEETITLKRGDVVTGNLTVKRLNLDELVEMGVDLSAPENYHTFRFQVELWFAGRPLPVIMDVTENMDGIRKTDNVNTGKSIGSYTEGDSTIEVELITPEITIEEDDVAPKYGITYLQTTQSVSWLKDMYDVQLGIINNADSGFVITNASATINLPDGLSLAATKSGQTTTTRLPDLDGQESASASWVIKGDKTGEYRLSASFHGVMQPFGADMDAQFETKANVEVPGGEGLHIYVYPEDAYYPGEDYYIQFVIANESAREFYNLKTTLGEYIQPEKTRVAIIKDVNTGSVLRSERSNSGQTYRSASAAQCRQIPIMYDGDIVDVGVFAPGDAIYATYCRKMGNCYSDDIYYELVDSLVSSIEGENLGVEVSLSPIPSHVYKYIVITGTRRYDPAADMDEFNELMGDPIDMSTGAFLQELQTISLNGGNGLTFDLQYNSALASIEGEAGYGWSHDYEQRIEDHGNSLTLYMSPYSTAKFVNEEADSDIAYGTLQDDVIVLDGKAEYTGNYYPTGGALEGWVIEKSENGYDVTDSENSHYLFDSEGRLISIEDVSGQKATLTYGESSMRIEDEQTKESLTISYDEEGYINQVRDHLGRTVTLTHNGGNLTGIAGLTGNTSSYAYDGFHQMISATNADGLTYVRNTYDEYGRVLTQEEAGKAGVTRITYEDTEEGGVLITFRDGEGAVMSVITNKKGEMIKTVDIDGSTTEYIYDSHGNLLDEIDPYGNTVMYQYDENDQMIATYDTAGNVTFTDYDESGNPIRVYSKGQGTAFSYNSQNQLIRSVDPLGKVTLYSYDSRGNLTKQHTEGKGTLMYEYRDGHLTAQTDENGNRTTYGYDSYGNINQVTDAMGNVTLYTYDQAGQLISETRADGAVVTYEYDKVGQQVKSTMTAPDGTKRSQRFAYDGAGRLTQLIDEAGNITTYTYDSYGNKTSTLYPDGTKDTFIYDLSGNLIKKTTAAGMVTEYTYDLNHNMLSETTDGTMVRFEYYPNGKVHKQIMPDGLTYTYSYDNAWNCVLISDNTGRGTIYTYDLIGNCTMERDSLGNTVYYEYDVYGRCIKVTDPNGNTTRYDYDNNDNCIRQTDALGNVTYMTYDSLNRLVKTSMQTDDGEITNTYVYDAMGRTVSVTDGEGITVYMTYDAFGGLLTTMDGEGNIVETNTYDSLGQVARTEDALGNVTTYTYDRMGKVTEAIGYLGTDRQEKTDYSYDADGRILAVTDNAGNITRAAYDGRGNVLSVTDAMGGTTSYSYDSMNRVTQVINAISAKETYTYNARGLLAEAKDNAGNTTEYIYDDIGRITRKKDALGTISYTYDKNGNVLTVSDKNGTITRTYDALNRVTSVTDHQGNTISYGYDQLGNRISITYAGGEKVRYTYDKTGRLLTVTDKDGNVTYYAYDKNGRLTETRRGNGTREVRTYDVAGRLLTLTDKTAAGAVINEYAYTYDAAGNITEITGMDAGISAETTDVLLKNQTTAEGTIAISVSMTYDKDNRLLSYNNQKIEYDANGNMIRGPLNGAMADFAYDCRNRLVKVTEADGTVTTYEYDAEDIRIASTTGNIRTEYTTDRQSAYSQTLIRTDYEKSLLGTGKKVKEKTIYTYGLGLINERRNAGEQYYYHYNHIGSTMAVSDQSGEVLYRFVYDTYGELSDIRTGDSISLRTIEKADDYTLEELAHAAGFTYLYNGQYGVETDQNGLYYMRARYYDQDIKRFINRDIVSGDITNSKSLNRYAYVQGNPVSLTDPFGLCPDSNSSVRLVRTFLCDTDWSTVGHTALDIVGIFWDGADLINVFWYAAEGNTEMAITSAVYALPGIGMASGRLMMWSDKLYKAGKTVYRASKLTQGCYGVIGGLTMAGAGIGNIYNSLKNG
ncbi:MAG: PKD domain-containing protein, partial [Lachnospiraceae bacterium]|nr:PKD domain-containing protein [Lachnospiraceae bacterium]